MATKTDSERIQHIVDKAPSLMHQQYADWILEKTGVKVPVKHVKLVYGLINPYQKSEEGQANKAARHEAVETAREAAKRERAEAAATRKAAAAKETPAKPTTTKAGKGKRATAVEEATPAPKPRAPKSSAKGKTAGKASTAKASRRKTVVEDDATEEF